MHQQVDAIQMSIHNICLYKEVDKKDTGCNLKTVELLDCALIGVCAVIRLNMVIDIYTHLFITVLLRFRPFSMLAVQTVLYQE